MRNRLYIAILVVVALAALSTAAWFAYRAHVVAMYPHLDADDAIRSHRWMDEPPAAKRSPPSETGEPPRRALFLKLPGTKAEDEPDAAANTNNEPSASDEPKTAAEQPALKTSLNPSGTTNNEWTEPTNARVLGRSDWMAPVSPEEEARIDEVFENARAARFDPRMSNKGRATSIEVAREVIDRCFDQLESRYPDAEGRLIVAWRSGAADGRGWIRQPRISVNYRLDDAEFEACIVDGLDGRTFAAEDGDAIDVEAPFFYDGSF